MTRSLLAAAVVLGALTPIQGAAAGEFNPLGDGSDANNGDLLRDPAAGCENCSFAAPPPDWNDPFFDIDWSLSLRGAYVQDSDGAHFEALAIPSVTLRHDTMRGGYAISGSAELSKSSVEDYRLEALELSLDGEYALDQATELRGNLDLALSQDSPGAPGQADDVATAPLVVEGEAGIAADRRFGQFVVGGRATAGRTVYGPTTLADASEQDNSAQNNWTVSGGLRLGYAVTPVLTAFVDGSAGYQFYDAPSPIYLVALDAADYQLRTGLAAQWHDILEAEVSVGLGLRRFAEPALGEVTATLYDASLTFRPDETVELSAALATSIDAPGPDSGGTARIEYEATAEASYVVNPWLKLRASAGWRQAQLAGTTSSESGYSFGSGLDYALNEHATLTADYDFSREETTSEPGEDEQRVTLGVTLSR